MAVILSAIRLVLSKKTYLILAIAAALLMFAVLILLPVGRISAKAFYYQLTSLDAVSIAVMVLFSIVLGASFSMNIYLFRKTHESKKKVGLGGFLSLFSSFFAGIFGSAVCVACLSILVGFLGLPVLTFLIARRQELFVLWALLAVGSLYLSSKAVVGHQGCEVCKLKK